MKKIAIPTDGQEVAVHFGRCSKYTIFDLDDDVVNKEVIDNPGHSPGFLPRYLHDMGVEVVLASGMGIKAKTLFDNNDIEVVTGVRGDVDICIKDYIDGTLESEDNTCDHDGSEHHGQAHGHHH